MDNKGILRILNTYSKSFVGIGFFVTSNGYILTCYHVLEAAQCVSNGCTVSFKEKNSSEILSAIIIDFDKENDIALLKTNCSPVVYYTIKENGKKNDKLTVFGFIDDGEVETIANPILQSYVNNNKYIQLGKANGIANGFSGSPVLKENGYAIGIIRGITSAEHNRMTDIAFAIPSQIIIHNLFSRVDDFPINLDKNKPSSESVLKANYTNSLQTLNKSFFISREHLLWWERYLVNKDKLLNLIMHDPSNSIYYYYLGVIYSWLKKKEHARDMLKEAINLDDSHAEYHYEIGVAYNRLKQFENAKCSHKKALEIKENFPECTANLAFSFYMTGEIDSALKIVNHALKINEKSAILYRRLAWINIKTAKENFELCPIDVLEYLDKSIELEKDLGYQSMHYNIRAEYFLSIGELGKAKADLEESEEIYPYNDYTYFLFSEYYAKIGKPDLQKACWEKAKRFGFEQSDK